MKTYMPLNGLRWSRNSGSANCDMPQSAVFGRPGGGVGNFSKICGAKQKENHSEEQLSLRGATRNRIEDTRPRIFSDQSFALPTELWHHRIKNNTEKRVIPKNNSLYVVPPGIEPGIQGQEFLTTSPLLYPYT